MARRSIEWNQVRTLRRCSCAETRTQCAGTDVSAARQERGVLASVQADVNPRHAHDMNIAATALRMMPGNSDAASLEAVAKTEYDETSP
eukprot:6188927-Pleurochrysis_carterae.AAC.1